MLVRHADRRYSRLMTFTIIWICWEYKIFFGQHSKAISECWYFGPFFEPPYLGGKWFFQSICSQLLNGKDDTSG